MGKNYRIIRQVPESKLGNNKADVIHNRGARATMAADAAITQQNKMDSARSAGQATDREVSKQNRILMNRRKLASTFTKLPRGQFVKAKTSNPNIMSTNPSGAGAKASTLNGRNWMWNIGAKTK